MLTKAKSVVPIMLVGFFALWVGLRVAREHWSIGIIADHRIPPHPVADPEVPLLSPDGSVLLTLRRQSVMGKDGISGLNIESRNFSTGLVSVQTLATVPVTTPEFGVPSVYSAAHTYCSHGKYVLLYLGGDTFGVLNGSTLELQSRISFPADEKHPPESAILSGACAANSSFAAFELAGPKRPGVTRVFDLSNGKQVAEISADISPRKLMNLDVSPSGNAAAVLFTGSSSLSSLLIIDLHANRVAKRIEAGMDGFQVAWVGDSMAAVATRTLNPGSVDSKVSLFDVQSGRMVRQLGVSGMVAETPISASADGTRLLAYTGVESTNEHGRQIGIARFTVWDAETGKIVAQSHALPVLKTAAGESLLADLNPWGPSTSWRPEVQLSQVGNAALVTQGSEPIDVFSLK